MGGCDPQEGKRKAREIKKKTHRNDTTHWRYVFIYFYLDFINNIKREMEAKYGGINVAEG